MPKGITYEVYGYKTVADYEDGRFTLIEDGFLKKKDALAIGKNSLEQYDVVKVQSSDREEIEVLAPNQKKVKVYLLDDGYVDPEVLGIYSTQEKAKLAAMSVDGRGKIVEFVLDAPPKRS